MKSTQASCLIWGTASITEFTENLIRTLGN